MTIGPLHPGLAEPRTKEEWRHYLAAVPPQRPEPLTPAAHQALPQDARDDFDYARHAWHSALVLIRTQGMRHIHNEIKIKLLANAHQPAGARRGVVIDGPPTVGKSTLVKMFAADFEKTLRRRDPHKFQPHDNDGYVVDYTPVVYISIPSQATPKDLSAAFAEWFNIPLRRAATKNEITDAVLRAARLCGVQLIIIDDVHFLDLSAKEGKVVNDHLKYLANHCPATFVFTGHDLESSGLFLEGGASERATQTSGRNSLHKLELFKIGTEMERRAWASVVKTMEDALVLLGHQPGTLVRDYEYLHHRTGGSIASLSLLIREGAIRAVVTGEETVTRKVLEQVVIDRRATRGYNKIRKQRRTRPPGTPRQGTAEPPAEAG